MNPSIELASFRNPDRASANALTLARDLPEEVSSRLFYLAGASADPDGVMQALVRLRAARSGDFSQLARNPALAQPLVAAFANSRFLTEEILQEPDWIQSAVQGGDFHSLLSSEDLELRLEAFLLARGTGDPTALLVAQFRRQQILRILLRELSGLATLAETTGELSNLADAILNVTYTHIRDELVRKHGMPRYTDEAGESRVCEFSVIALGKLGGQELNYSSDIDLMFVYTANGETDGARPLTNKEFFKKVATQYTALLSTYTAEGVCYRVDLRLRPDGAHGEICLSLEGTANYYRQRGRDWELQMLIKARVAAGDPRPGRELLEAVEPLIYSSTLDFGAVEAVSEARERIQEKLQQKKGDGGTLDIKLAPGGIRDIEFLVQCLQRLHGGREPWVRHGGTLLALFRLRAKNLLSDVEYQRLAAAYEFLRHLEHKLQLEDDRQTHALPVEREKMHLLARRMPVTELGSEPSIERLREALEGHLSAVREIYERVIHAQQPALESVNPAPGGESNLKRFLEQRAPNLAAAVSGARSQRGAKALERFLESAVLNSEWLRVLDGDGVLMGYLVDIFEHSPFFADQLMRFPELLEELRRVRLRPGQDSRVAEAAEIRDANELRRFFRREMFRVQCESICLKTPVFTTLKRASELADAAVNAAYRISLDEVRTANGPLPGSYEPKDQMMVIALGRLGMYEFDQSSDADLIFVLPDSDGEQHQFWTRVATKLIERLSAYTREGSIFAVDTRLRPNGRAGELVQPEGAYKDYFSQRAEAWEGITYMKARAVAGDIERATLFLNELQDLDWRRYGQSGRSQQQLRQMRLRLEKEQGEHRLKEGRGGYYDIDFALLYLRLKGAGIFYKVLNTPERIDVIEKMGHLERSDAAFLRDAAVFYRAVDHGLRLLTGQAEAALPKSETQMEMLTSLVSRWTPDHLHDQPLAAELAQIQERTREFFNRVFGA